MPSVASKPGSLRESKKLDTRDRIVRTALRLFIERGYEATSVAQIARDAGSSPRTFFRYFAKKEDVVFFDEDVIHELWQRSLAERLPGDTLVARFRRAARNVLRFLNQDNPAASAGVGFLRAMEPALLGRYHARAADLENLVAQVAAEEYGSRIDDPKVQFAAAALAGAFLKMGQLWMHGGGMHGGGGERGGDLLDVALTMLRPGIDHPEEG
jgi:AcrR family transcriptional regulator